MNQNQTESKPTDAEQPREEGLDETTCSALVRRCDVCGIINACDLDATPARWKELQLPDHTVMKVTEAEAMELWKNAGRCDHKKYIEELRAKIHAQNAGHLARKPAPSDSDS